jgi:hypothetical protein
LEKVRWFKNPDSQNGNSGKNKNQRLLKLEWNYLFQLFQSRRNFGKVKKLNNSTEKHFKWSPGI